MPRQATRRWRLDRPTSALFASVASRRRRYYFRLRHATTVHLVLLGSLYFVGIQAYAQAPHAGAGASAPQKIGPSAELYLEVSIHGQATSLISRFVLRDGQLYASGADLQQLGFSTDKMGVASDRDVSLESLHVPYVYNASRLTIDLDVPDALLTPHDVNARANGAPPASASALHGIVLNYDVYTQTSPQVRTSMSSELRFFSPSGVFSQTSILESHQSSTRLIRYDTNWVQSRQASLSILQLGDTVTGSLDWTRSVRIAGIQLRRDFALRPDLITYPIPNLRGSTAVPSAVDLYINDIRQFSSQVPSGPFVLNQVPGITGAGVATVVTRDALGRSVATSVPLYVDTRLLAAGLSSYAFEAGFLRRNYGVDSFDYQRTPAFSVTGAHGVTDTLTVNGHAEGTGGVFNAGGGAYFGLGQAGVVNGALAASVGTGTGGQISVGYQLLEPRFAINLDTQRTLRHYSDVGSRAGDPVPLSTDRATVSLPFFSRQSISFSYIGYKLPDGPTAKVGSLSYIVNLGNLLSLNMSLFHDFGNVPTSGIFVGMNIGFGSRHSGGSGTSINTSFGRQNGEDTYNVNANSAPAYGGGFGWGVQAGRAGTLAYQQAQAEYVGNVGQVTAVAQSYGGQPATSLDVSGALVFMNSALFMSRRIDDSFALVTTDGVGHVPVMHDNRVIGITSSRGYLLIPDLNAYQHNQISIDPMNLPADERVSTTAMDLVPESHSGVLGHFGITHFDAATLILHDRNGKPIAVGTPVRNVNNGQNTVVGYDGQAFIESLQAHNHLQIGDGAQHCDIRFDYQHTDDGGLHTIGPLTCDLGNPAPHKD